MSVQVKNQSSVKSINDKNLINLINGNIRTVTQEMLDDGVIPVAITPDEVKQEEIQQLALLFNEKLNKLKTNTSAFSLDQLRNTIHKDDKFPQLAKNNQILNQVILNYRELSPDGDEIVCVGDPKLDLFTTRSQLEQEIRLVELISDINENVDFSVDPEIVKKAIKDKEERSKFIMSNEQKKAVYACTYYNSYNSLVEGYAGAGKSTTMGVVSMIYQLLGYKLRGITLSWKAAEVLKIETKMPCISMQAFISDKEKMIAAKESPFTDKEMIIVDEAGLIGVNQMVKFLEIVKSSPYPIKVIFSGDTQQLEPIGEPNALELIQKVMDKNNHAIIGEIRRQNSLSHRKCVLALKDGYSGEALYTYHQQEAIQFCNNTEHIKNKVLQDYLSAIKKNPNETNLIICYENKTVFSLNDKIREIMINIGNVDSSREIELPIVRKSGGQIQEVVKKFAVGDHIMFTENDKNNFLHDKKTHEKLNTFLSNRLSGKISKITGNLANGYDITVDINIDDTRNAYVVFNTKQYSKTGRVHIDYNYAITAYSSQGQTVDRVFLIDSKQIDRRHAYVLCSRHRKALHIYANKEELKQDMIKNKKYKDDVDFDNNASTLSMLNHIGSRWGRESKKQSVVAKFLDALDEIKQINIQYPNAHIDITNLNDNYLKLRTQYRIDKARKEKEKTLFQKPKENFAILDTPEYYKTPADKVDLDELKTIKGIYNEQASSYDIIPQKELKGYQLSDVITEELFTELKSKFFDIGKGGVLNMISKINDTVISKYNIYGKDVLQTGYPFIISADGKSTSKDILVCEDLNQFMDYLKIFYLDNNNHNRNIPTLIWGTDDTDYKFIFNALNDRNIYMIGSHDYKQKHFIKMTQALTGYQLRSTFSNFHDSWLSGHYKEKVEEGSLTQIKYAQNINYDIAAIQPYYLETSVVNTNAQTFKKNTFIDKEGKISNEILAKFIRQDNLMTEKLLQEEVLPNRTFNRLEAKVDIVNKRITKNMYF